MNASFIHLAAAAKTVTNSSVFAIEAPQDALKEHPEVEALSRNDAVQFAVAESDASFATILNLSSVDFTRNLALIGDRIAHGDRLLLNVRIDGADLRAVTAAKDLGAYEFVSTDSAKESYDFFLLSVLLLAKGRDNKSVVHFYKPQDEANKVQLPYTSEEVAAWLDRASADDVRDLGAALAHLKKLAGADYAPLKTYPARGWLHVRRFDQALLFLGDAAAFEPQLKPLSIVLAQIKIYRPFPLQEVRKLLAHVGAGIAALQIAQQTALQLQFSPLLLDVLELLPEVSKAGAKVVCSQIAGASAANAATILKHMVQNAKLPAPVQNLTFGRSATGATGAGAASAPGSAPADNVYLSILLHEAARATKTTILNEYGSGKSPEYALGQFLQTEKQRQALADLVESKLASFHGELNEQLAQWVLWVRSADRKKAAGARPRFDAPALVAALEGATGSAAQAAAQLLKQRSLLDTKATWIVGSDSWSYDKGLAAFHGALKSGNKDLKLLIIDSDDSVSRRQGKKDLGLFAMNYGNAYVASVAVYSSYTQTLEALEEASAFSDGPAVVVAYMPCASAADPVESLRATRRAVDTGYWPLYRFNPSAKTDDGRFKLDSTFIRRELQDFLKRENRLTALAAKSSKLQYNLQTYSATVGKSTAEKRRLAYAELIEGMAGEPMTVGYASDNGNAAGLAKKFAYRAGHKGFKVRLVELDGIDIETELADVGKFIAITSTSGQGEFPNGGKQFWEALRGTAVDLAQVGAAVFALGDSKYWPRPEDAGYFARPGRQLDTRLKALGAQMLCGCGVGDDQDEDGFNTGYNKWEPEVWRALGVSVENSGDEPAPLTNEQMKLNSNYLRGTIQEGFEDESTGAISASDQQLTKFHGVYMQDDRDLRDERRAEGLEPAYAFMVRVRLPGNVSTPEQWLQIDKLSDTKGNHTFKITTRGTYQLHGIVKKDIVAAVRDINAVAMDTLGACGDVNRNSICSAAPTMRHIHEQMAHMARIVSARLMPHTLAYHELFLTDLGPVERGEEGGPRRPAKYMVGGHAVAVQGGAQQEAELKRQREQEKGAPGSPYGNDPVEPMYGPAYLPRKIKVAITVPPFNDVDVYANDIGLVSIVENGEIVGFDLLAGGGMGVTHNNTKTYPRAGTLLGYIPYDLAPEVCENIVIIQRDNGDRENRKHARLKYTIDTMGVDEFKRQLQAAVGFKLQPARPFKLTSNRDHFGWCKDEEGFNHFTCYIENGRVADTREQPHKTGMRLVAQYMIDHQVGRFRLTGNQHVIIADITDAHKASIDAILKAHALLDVSQLSGLRMASQSCVAFPTCGLAMAEAERFLPQFLDAVENELDKLGLRSDSIVLRMTGCPNGCARPWMAEVALVGKSYGFYNLLLGGSYVGDRVNKLYRANVDPKQALAILVPMFRRWAAEREPGEHFGDFVVRVGIIKATLEGKHFWDDLNADVQG